ncbi:MAG: serine hydrolase domain-containing protein [Acidobacteriaceae bacterium]
MSLCNVPQFRKSKALLSCLASLLLAGSLLPGSALSAQNTLPAAEQSKVDAIAQQVLEKTGVPSASVGIVTDGKVSYLKAYGDAELHPPVPAEPQMRYSIGSISKQFTAAAILILQQQGRLSIDDHISKWLPQLTRANEVTLRELLSHTSGYQDYYAEDYLLPYMKQPTTPDEILDKWGKKPLDFDPGTQWQYSNTNYVIAGKIVEMVSDMPLMTFLRQQIFTPLRMDRVIDYNLHPLAPTDAHGYARYALGPLRPATREGNGWIFGAGELAMPVGNLLLWDISMMNESLLQPASYTQMETGMKLKDGQDTHYGFGVGTSMRADHLVISHSGGVSGFITDNLVLPKDKVAVAVFTNADASNAAGAIASKVAALLVGLPPDESKQSTDEARQIFVNLQNGKIDRSLFTANCNSYFTPQAISDYAASLKPLGPPLAFRQVTQSLRGGMTFRVYDVFFPHQHLTVTEYQMPDGKIEQYLVIPANN